MPIDRDFTIATLQTLVRIDSRNPGLEDGAPGELAIARHVQGILVSLGWQAELRDHGQDRASVLARRPGTGGGRSLMLNTHLDTVGTAGMDDPFDGELREGKVWGRGAQDIKGGVAAILGLAKALADANTELRGDLVLALVADEEHASIGTADAIGQVRTDAAVVLEPSDLDVSVGHRGMAVFELEIRGRTAHGGRPDRGIDANRLMALVLAGVDRRYQAWACEHAHPLLGTPSYHVPQLSGGGPLFAYADRCTASIECRTVPGMTEDALLAGLRTAVAEEVVAVAGAAGSATCRMWRDPYEIDVERPIVRAALAAAEAVRGEPPQVICHSWWEDSALLGAAGIETVITGPAGGGLHTAIEWVDAQSVVDLAAILHRLAVDFCNTEE